MASDQHFAMDLSLEATSGIEKRALWVRCSIKRKQHVVTLQNAYTLDEHDQVTPTLSLRLGSNDRRSSQFNDCYKTVSLTLGELTRVASAAAS